MPWTGPPLLPRSAVVVPVAYEASRISHKPRNGAPGPLGPGAPSRHATGPHSASLACDRVRPVYHVPWEQGSALPVRTCLEIYYDRTVRLAERFHVGNLEGQLHLPRPYRPRADNGRVLVVR